MKILVTGATGFIGSNLVPLLKTKHDVSALDARLVGKNSTDWHAQVDNCDALIHLAGLAHVSIKSSDSAIYRRINTDLTETLARRLAQNGKHMVFLSTSVVYGQQSQSDRPFQVTDLPIINSPYAESKIAAENAIKSLQSAQGLSYSIIRPPLVYGPRVKANFLAMLRWVNSGVPLPLGAVRNLRSMVGVRNLADLIEICTTNTLAKNQTVNVSDGQDVSTIKLLSTIANAMDRKPKLVTVPLGVLKLGSQIIRNHRAYDVLCTSFQLDIAETKRMLAWNPPFSMHEEIHYTVNWFAGTTS